MALYRHHLMGCPRMISQYLAHALILLPLYWRAFQCLPSVILQPGDIIKSNSPIGCPRCWGCLRWCLREPAERCLPQGREDGQAIVSLRDAFMSCTGRFGQDMHHFPKRVMVARADIATG